MNSEKSILTQQFRSKFNFEVTFAKDGTVSERNIYFIIDEFTSYDITSDTFRDNPEWDKFLHWTDGWRSVMSDAISSKSQHHFNR